MAPAMAGRVDRLLRMQQAVSTLITGLGEDVEREGLLDTPKRVAKALLDVTAGYHQDPEGVINQALFHEPIVLEGGSGVVLVRDIDFASTSEDCLLPFHGRCHVAYRPAQGVVLGLSKLARLVRVFAKRLQTQARLGQQVATALHQTLECSGVAVVLEARHLEVRPRPLERVTACASGCFAEEGSSMLEEVLLLLGLDESRLALCDVQRMDVPPRAAAASEEASLEPAQASAQQLGGAGSDLPAAAPGLRSSSDATSTPSSVSASSTPDLSEKDSEKEASSSSEGDADTDGDGDSDSGAGICDGVVGLASSDTRSCSAGPMPAGSCSSSGRGALVGGAAAHGGKGRVGAVGAMEAAVRQLLVEVGEDTSREGLQCTARRYVESLLASTSGYNQPLPPPRKRSGQRSATWSNSAAAQHGEQQAQSPAACGCSSSTPAASLLEQHSPGEGQGEGALELLHFQVPFSSQCEHHMLPFYGVAHVAVASGGSGGGASSGQAAASGRQSQPGQEGSSCPLSLQEVQQVVQAFTQRLQVQERITHQVADALEAIVGEGAQGLMVVVDAAHMCMVARGVENHAGRTMTTAVRGAMAQRADLRRQVVQRAAQSHRP